jgi:hypothetical protein
VAVHPSVVRVSGCDPFSAHLIATYAAFGIQIPAEAANGTFNCPLQHDLLLNVTVCLNGGVVDTITVGGRTCHILRDGIVNITDATTMVPCVLPSVGQGLFQDVIVTAHDSTLVPLPSLPAPLVSFRVPVVMQVKGIGDSPAHASTRRPAARRPRATDTCNPI